MTVEQAKAMISFQTKMAINSGDEIEHLKKENEELKAQIKLIESVTDANADKVVELKAQIEKMKCCGNCKHHLFWNTELHCELPLECIRFVCYAKCREDKWEEE